MKKYKMIRVSQETHDLLNSNKGKLSFDYVIRTRMSLPVLQPTTRTRKPKRDARNQIIKAMWADGKTQKELATIFDLSSQTIHRIIHFNGKIGY